MSSPSPNSSSSSREFRKVSSSSFKKFHKVSSSSSSLKSFEK